MKYIPLEKIRIPRPVHRISHIIRQAKGRRALDLGCYDETALAKRGGGTWLHEELSRVAIFVLGVDNSPQIPETGLSTGEKSRIIRGDACHLEPFLRENPPFDLIVAGELIEHFPNTLEFFLQIKKYFSGREFICSTPNASSLVNMLLSLVKRESCHKDHLQIYSFKTLNTLCLRAGFAEWEIIPYHVYFTEMILASRGATRIFLSLCEKFANLLEFLFPLASGGLILHVKKI